jgi:hypothetical protein
VRDLVLAGGLLYAATGNGVSISDDGGASFSNVTAGLGSLSVNDLVVSGSTIYAGTDGGLSISEDGGASFTLNRTTANGLGSDYVGALAFDGTRLYACTGEPWVSGTMNSFVLRGAAEGLTSTYLYDVAVDGAGTVLVAANGGLFRSDDHGATFAQVTTTPNYPRGVFAQGTTWYVAAPPSGVAISQDGGATWIVRDAGVGASTVSDVWYMPPP